MCKCVAFRQVRGKERELSKMREVISSLKEEMDVVAKENAERQARALACAAKASEKAGAERAADDKMGERMARLQERMHGLQAEVRALKQKESSAQKGEFRGSSTGCTDSPFAFASVSTLDVSELNGLGVTVCE